MRLLPVSILIVAVGLAALFANALFKANETAVAPAAKKKREPILLLPGEGQPDGAENRWKVTAAETLGAYTLRYSVHGTGGPPLHTHTREDEAWYVLEGELSFQVGDRTLVGSPGSFVFAPRGIHHRYWNSGGTTAKYLMMFSPGGLEKFFQERREIPGRDPSKGNAEQSAEWNERAAALGSKYGLHRNSEPSGKGKAILVPPDDGTASSSPGRVIISDKDTVGAFAMMGFTLKPQDAPGALRQMDKDAAWYVLDGELTFEIGDRKFVAPKGAFVLLPRGTGHRVWTSGKTPTKYLLIRSPG